MIKNALKILTEASNPIICTGGGVINSGASLEVKELVEKTGSKVVSTLMGLGSFPGNDPSFMGMLGTYGNEAANIAVQTCDCFLALGMRFDDRVIGNPEKFAPHAKIIHIDIDPAEIGKNIAVDVPIVGDIKSILGEMIEQLGDNGTRSHKTDRPHKNVQVNEGLNVPWVLRSLKRIASEDLIITTDVGQHQLWTAQHFTFNKSRTLISSGGLGTMGYGIPAALGAQLAQPKKTVVVITGDGSFQMGMPELGTIAELDLPIKIIIFNNGTLGMVRQLQHHYCGQRYAGVDFKKTLDFMHLAKAYGAEYYRIESEKQVPEVFKEALVNEKFTIIECPVDPEDLVLPIVLAGKGLEEMML